MTPDEFARYRAEGYTRIPLAAVITADLETPLSTFLKLADVPMSFLFESVQGGETWGRYSIIGLACRRRIEVRGHEVTLHERCEGGPHGGDAVIERETCDDPLDWIERYQARFRVPAIDGLPSVTGVRHPIRRTLPP